MKLVKFREIKVKSLCAFFLFFFFFFPFFPVLLNFCFVRLPFDRSWSFNHAGTWTGRLDLRVWISCVCDVHVCMGVYWGSAGVWSGNVSSCRGEYSGAQWVPGQKMWPVGAGGSCFACTVVHLPGPCSCVVLLC